MFIVADLVSLNMGYENYSIISVLASKSTFGLIRCSADANMLHESKITYITCVQDTLKYFAKSGSMCVYYENFGYHSKYSSKYMIMTVPKLNYLVLHRFVFTWYFVNMVLHSTRNSLSELVSHSVTGLSGYQRALGGTGRWRSPTAHGCSWCQTLEVS